MHTYNVRFQDGGKWDDCFPSLDLSRRYARIISDLTGMQAVITDGKTSEVVRSASRAEGKTAGATASRAGVVPRAS